MADVNLSVDVSSSGVDAAVARIDNLRKSGVSTGDAFTKLAGSVDSAMSRIARDVATTEGKFTGFRNATDKATGGIARMVEANRLATQSYKDLALAASRADQQTASGRLAAAGGGSLAAGRKAASRLIQQQNVFNADPIRDELALRAQENALIERKSQLLSAQAQIERQRFDQSLAGMNKEEAQQARITRAQADLNKARSALGSANSAISRGGETPERVERQIAATNQLRAAEADLFAARQKSNDLPLDSSYRYLILAGLASQVTQGLVQMGSAAIVASAQIERSFADVERTFEGTDAQLAHLQGTLFDLSTTNPSGFVDLAQIATLGNQLGIAAADVENFTTVIAQYTAVSGESAETAATAFGRISNLTGLAASQYSNLASAITYTARTTVATESTIQNTAKEISALSAGAGFSAQAIVGLAGALSSLAIPPERARGALSLYFGALNSAVAEGGPKLEAFAQLTGYTAEQLNKMVRENRGQEVFTAFIQGLSELDTVAKTSALDTLGLSTIRVDQTMRALAQNVPLVTSAFAGASKAFDENTEIANQYAIIQATLDSQFKEFQNSVMNAAAAIGNEFAPAATVALEKLTEFLSIAKDVADSPLGGAFIKLAVGIAAVITALATVAGAYAVAKAGSIVLSYALLSMNPALSSNTAGITGWTLALIRGELAARSAAVTNGGLAASFLASGRAAVTGAAGMKLLNGAFMVMKTVLPILVITAAIAAFTELADQFDRAGNPSRNLTDDITGLTDALKSDNPELFSQKVSETGDAAGKTQSGLSAFNRAVLSAIDVQRQAKDAVDGTNNSLEGQTFRLGSGSKAWLSEALLGQTDIKDILDGRDFLEEVRSAFGMEGAGGDSLVNQDDLERLIGAGLDLDAIAEIGITQGKDAALAAYDAFRVGYNEANPGDQAANNLNGGVFGVEQGVVSNVLDSVIDSYDKASIAAALAGGAIEESGAMSVAAAADYDRAGNYIGELAGTADEMGVTFSGVTGRLSEFRDAIQGAISGSVGFDAVLQRAQDAAQALADATKDEDDLPLPVDAAGFGAALTQATDDALNFYNGIQSIADGGNTSFALQLAELGPEAQGILTGALALDGTGQAKLEASARFAAFIASDAFKNQLDASMSDSNEAYARILSGGGTLDTVKEYIAAQVAGTGAEFEKQWAISHPNLPLNVTPELANPTPEALALWSEVNSGRIKVTATIVPGKEGTGRGGQGGPGVKSNTYTDTLTGSKITLPATLNQETLTKSLLDWRAANTNSKTEVGAKLSTVTFNSDIAAWVAGRGPIKIPASLSISQPAGGLTGSSPTRVIRKNGGWGNEENMPRFANGGGWGQFRGPGGGRSDSILARVSNNEFINTADSTKYWGADFFDSLNRKMLPTAFLSMLGAASVSGNQGPKKITNVNVTQVNPLTRDPLVQLREDSEKLASGLW